MSLLSRERQDLRGWLNLSTLRLSYRSKHQIFVQARPLKFDHNHWRGPQYCLTSGIMLIFGNQWKRHDASLLRVTKAWTKIQRILRKIEEKQWFIIVKSFQTIPFRECQRCHWKYQEVYLKSRQFLSRRFWIEHKSNWDGVWKENSNFQRNFNDQFILESRSSKQFDWLHS